MNVKCCDKCAARIYSEPEEGQVMSIEIEVNIDEVLLEAATPAANTKLVFCSALCASKYLDKFLKLEAKWLTNWKNGGILGKKNFVKVKK